MDSYGNKCPQGRHGAICRMFMNHGSMGCKDHQLCGKVHPKLCKEAMKFKICGQHWCTLRHPRWDQFEPGTAIPPLGAHNGGQWREPPKD